MHKDKKPVLLAEEQKKGGVPFKMQTCINLLSL